jgi:RND family efflux transporter MFP subunit
MNKNFDPFCQIETKKFKAIQIDRVSANQKKILQRITIAWIVLIANLLLIPWVQTASGVGKVVAFNPNEREQEVSATLDGIVKHWFVQEGSRVKAGDPLVELSDNDPSIISRLESEKTAIRQRLTANESAVNATKTNLERQKKLFLEGLSAQRDVELAQVEYSRYLVDAANAAAELAKIEVRISRQLTQKIYAPVSGTILKVVAGQGGRVVKSGEMLATLIPETDSRVVELWVSGNDVPLIQVGSRVRLQFEGWPAVQFSGWPSLAIGTFEGAVKFIDPSDSNHGKFRVLVEPSVNSRWPNGQYLRQGIRTLGWIQLGRVSLAFEIWRQINGFPPSVASKESLLEEKAKK